MSTFPSTPLPLTVNCSIVFGDVPLLERPAAAAAAGFDAVEFWWPFDRPVPSDHEVDAFVTAVSDAGVVLTGLNFAAGDMPAGERGILSDPDRATAFADNVEVAVGIGSRLGTTGFNALYGNRIPGVAPEAQDELAAEHLALAGRAAGRIGAVALLEPVSGVDAYPVRTAADAVAVLDRVGSDDVRLLLDVYHLAVNGDDPAAAIDRYAGRIGHVQIADAPGRGEPGTGGLPIAGLVDRVHAAGYRGRISLEYKPTTSEPFAWLARPEGARA
ncbi:Hydroxypyruvate isomerase [Pseudonocardia sp. Ae168_Ps1]|uniref:hydroxypyruvate isomerase family protein n=1 Tax=unclassified Pseudonocardia TaxID=2619320 RepID=UPI0009644126|nr:MULTISPECIES: TIM barrel protein [unclassified Pseudonocardia]OLL72428.1 Hydroxypyruvate isomerase [Pseudonocardia sp. Ae150A_Ps1]OLL78400.1 Hydroxypyruvate isomerase [Pseudonocardia sp. Ae168_Ps1]OLL87474.1 Hydroxypyruvate isomerase [Pseudonocardia sp. Ae263_Ps1]OLL92497.1 Hydroxypyruvate isomerase [Pseudonocardia sp. Ae356_Ps1]